MKKIITLSLLMCALSLAAFADIPRPTPPAPTPKKSIDGSLVIRLDKQAKEARLVIPKSQLAQLRAELENLDGAAGDRQAFLSFSRTQTIVGGLFLSLAFITGGVWFARAKPGAKAVNGKTLAAGAVIFLIGAATTLTLANAGPPPVLRSISGKLFDKKAFEYWRTASGRIKIEVADDDSRSIELIVPDTEAEAK